MTSKFYLKKAINFETSVATDIKVIAEVEKIWIMFDLDNNKTLDFKEIQTYVNLMVPKVEISDEEVFDLFQAMDTDSNGKIVKNEMLQFLKKLRYSNEDIKQFIQVKNADELTMLAEDPAHNYSALNRTLTIITEDEDSIVAQDTMTRTI